MTASSHSTHDETSIGVTLAAFAEHADRVAITHQRGAWTFGELLDRAHRMARALQAQGLSRGDVVALATGNRPETFTLRYAANILGCCTAVLYEDLSPTVLTEILQAIDATAVVFAPDRNPERISLAIQGRPGTIALALGTYPGVADIEDQAAKESPEPLPIQARPEDLSSIRLTGGSTGTPKGIPQDFTVPFHLSGPALKMWVGAIQLMCTAVGHLAGTLAESVLAAGGRVVLQDWFQPDQVLKAIEREAVTFIWLQPAMLHQLLDHPALDETNTSSLRMLMISGGPSSPHRITQAIKRFGPIITQGYGAYEIGQISILSPKDHERPELLSTVGRPVPGTQVSIRNPDGDPAETGLTGEIWVRGPGMMRGYYKQPEPTALALQDGWFHTGDLGFLDNEGYLTVVGRSKDTIIGIRDTVYPARLEDVLHQHPGIQQAVVFGLRNADNDESVCAAVVAAPNNTLSEDDIAEWARNELGGAYTPELVLILAKIPTTGSNKPDRNALRQLASERLGAKETADRVRKS
ncbi:class I adenylate-forming enzyme family protein [Nocardia sp. NPDC020380]|uniref:class I adenylate-forming enzyme family protein n=1 Tax=Nocardia sp. NPDC020380 TaxID=3364309 RepID=UPI003798FA5C